MTRSSSRGRPTVLTHADLYLRGAETLVASWEEYARAATGAALRRSPGVAAAVFCTEPERSVYNNALLERELVTGERAGALDAMEVAYAAAGVTRFAAWVHESDVAMRRDLERRGYTLDQSTRAMGMDLADLRMPRPDMKLGTLDWAEYLRVFDLPPGLLSGGDHAAFHLLVAQAGGENVATAMAYDFDTDCGIYNVATLEAARRRGLATALTTIQAYDAIERGCTTASLQSTRMAEGVYASVGFRDLGRMLEYVPAEPQAAVAGAG
jgi:GNAT superfamily N-acetyltransferase